MGRDDVAITPRTDWFLAEGATLGSFDEYVLMQNPNDAPTQVTTTFMKQNGSTIVRYITIPATARYTIKVNDVIDNEAVSVKLKSQEPIVAERAMYWDSESTIESNTHTWNGPADIYQRAVNKQERHGALQKDIPEAPLTPLCLL